MSTELEERLRSDMAEATMNLRVPKGLAQRAYRQHRKHQLRVRAATTVGAVAVLTAGGIAATAAIGSAGSSGPAPIESTAYVIARVERALGAAGLDNRIGFNRIVIAAPLNWEPLPGGPGLAGAGAGPPAGGYLLHWGYQGRERFAAYTASGQPVFEMSVALEHGVSTTAVLYQSQTWWTQTHPSNPPARGSALSNCARGGSIQLSAGAPGSGWPVFIRAQLACGAYAVVGHQVVDKVDAIKIVGQSGQVTVWVDPRTYLPVRLDVGPMQNDFQWLPATPANLALLTVTVPAGFRQVPPPAQPVGKVHRAAGLHVQVSR